MKKEIIQKIEIPKGIEAELKDSELIIKGPKGENKRTFKTDKIKFEKKDNYIILENKKSTKREKEQINTIAAHIKNMIKGVTEGFTYKLKICTSHFPVSTEIKDKEIYIKNFLGEKIPRIIKVPEGVEVDIQKENIIVSSTNKEKAGQAAANFENATRIKGRDRRIFQDGIYIINKCGKEI